MRHILVMNAKGGCGKSTVATNLASYYAGAGYDVALADFDPQCSSLDWAAIRPAACPPVHAIAAFADGLRSLPRNADLVIIDAPARSHGPELTELIGRAETIIVPVLPSPIDMMASQRFVREVNDVGKVSRREAKIGVVGNRVREQTRIFERLDAYLAKLRVPYLTALRDAQNYIRAYSRGIGIFELPEYLAWPDREQWAPIIEWLDSRRSLP